MHKYVGVQDANQTITSPSRDYAWGTNGIDNQEFLAIQLS